MSSAIVYLKCPKCGGMATLESFKIGDQYISCQRCGYDYSREQRYYDEKENTIYFKETESIGYGMYRVVKKDGMGPLVSIHTPVNEEMIEEFCRKLENDDVDKEKSFLTSYENGGLKVLYGAVQEDSFLLYENFESRPGFDPFKIGVH
jgi:DNA-directed RNA polymerase subunit M/transcription elongation factor TFIIS